MGAGPAFAAVQVARSSTASDLAALRRAESLSTPTALARTKTLPLAEALQPLVPGGALQRGTTVGVTGPGSTTLALVLSAVATAEGSWAAVAGVPALGLAAAAELGIALERLLVVARPPDGSWAVVVAALLDAVDLVVVRPPARLASADARRLQARARERGAVLCALGGTWPQPCDICFTVTAPAWVGPTGAGSGRLEARQVEVVGSGRGAASRERRLPLWLPGPDGAISTVAAPAATHPTQPVPAGLAAVS
ncbi:MAG: hypothetical protein WD232_04235 [Acidimicrobiales bacterium]